MSDLPPPGTVLGHVDDLTDPGARASAWNDGLVFLSRKGDEIRAWLNVCPHAGRMLSLPDGRVLVHEGQFLLCPVHGASFEMGSGECVGGPAAGDRLKPVEIAVVDGEIRAA